MSLWIFEPGATTPLTKSGSYDDLQVGMEYLVDGQLDPYAKELNTPFEWKGERGELRGVHTESKPFDWNVDSPSRPLEDLIIYEMHVRGFTQHASSGVQHPGTFLGVIEKIPHLLDLGINCVELMPIFEFDEREGNYWGYDSTSFFAPMKRYAVSDPIYELKQMIRALHRSGIEVILDVVYNHSSSFPMDYYITQDGNHTNYSGCGNTIDASNPQVSKLILDSLCYFADEFHVDGFRFDLAACLTRNNSTLIEQITETLSDKKLIAEPWDPGGLFMLGEFPKGWGEWNSVFRDGVRRQVNFGEPFEPSWNFASTSINYVTAHDGFTLRDLVSYDEKQNEANGEGNRDGSDQNFSRAGDHKVKRCTAMLDTLFSSKGTPMLLMGDEYGHTRRGNNNPWCQDELNWFLWDELNENQGWYDFVKTRIIRRKEEMNHA